MTPEQWQRLADGPPPRGKNETVQVMKARAVGTNGWHLVEETMGAERRIWLEPPAFLPLCTPVLVGMGERAGVEAARRFVDAAAVALEFDGI